MEWRLPLSTPDSSGLKLLCLFGFTAGGETLWHMPRISVVCDLGVFRAVVLLAPLCISSVTMGEVYGMG